MLKSVGKRAIIRLKQTLKQLAGGWGGGGWKETKRKKKRKKKRKRERKKSRAKLVDLYQKINLNILAR